MRLLNKELDNKGNFYILGILRNQLLNSSGRLKENSIIFG